MIRNRRSAGGRVRADLFAIVMTCVGAASGCAPTATFEVHQPRLPGRQQNMTLTSSNALYGHAEDRGAWHILMQFPLPGAASGRSKYVLYLHVPDPSSRESAAYPLGETAPARGFFVQKAGEGRGREVIVGGFVELRRDSGGKWVLKLLADGAVGTQIRGTAALERHDLDVRDYVEAHHRGDIADLLMRPTTTQKARP